MKTKMNLDVVAENNEEKKIEEFINLINKSAEVKNFIDLMENEAVKRNVFKFRSRIKSVESAIRTYRINKKSIEEVHDYVGISFITNTEDDIYSIVNDLNKELSDDCEHIDFVAEEYIYSPLVYIKWVPPLGYNIFAKEQLIENARKIPVEIRICSKEAFISEQTPYYSIQKNDTTNLPIEKKNQLRNIVQHISYKLALLNMRELSDVDRLLHTNELNRIINENKSFLKVNNDICRDAILDFGRLVYKVEHDKEFEKLDESLSNSNFDIDEALKNIFNELLGDKKEGIIDVVENAISEMRKIEINQILNQQ